jgi:diguanylate cyclase (GGDEF)-like protein
VDVPTLFFVEASLLFLFSLTMVVNSIGQLGQSANHWFAASNFCGGVSLVLHSFPPRDVFLTVIISNLLLFAELCFLNKAIAEFVERGRHLWLGLLGLSVVATIVTYYYYAVSQHPKPGLVMEFISVIAISTAACSAVLLFCYRSPGSKIPTFVMGTLFSLYLANNLVRSFTGYAPLRFYHIWLDRTIIAGLSFGFLWMTAARLRNSLEQLASTDSLTGTLNRRAVERETARVFNRSRQRNDRIAALMLDIDCFKQINDGYGHQAGDLALCAVANCLRSTMRAGDIIARLGGDEFFVVMPNTDADAAQLAANRIHAHLAELRVTCDIGEFGLRASIGVTSIEGSTAALEDLLKLGDRALYVAKAISRGEVSVFAQLVH